MSQSFPFKAEGVIELIAALPRAASDLVELLHELQRWQKADANSSEWLSALDMEALSRARKVEGDDRNSSLDGIDSESDFLTKTSFGDTSRGNPSLAVSAALASLERSAEMMRDIVEETRRDRLDFEIRRREIDRTLARIDRIFDSRLRLSQ